MTHWSEHTIWWHAYPLGFCGAPVRPTPEERVLTPRLKHLTSQLDYLIELGCSGLALGPIFTSNSHGYDTTNFYEIDPRLGTQADFEELVSECHARGIRIMLDGVFNHVGHGSSYQHLVAQDSVFEGHGDLLTLDHANPATVDLVADVMNFWLDKGVDAWRFDAAYSVPLDFWRQVTPRVKQAHPDAWFMGEVIHGDYAGFAEAMDSVTQYELWKSIWSSLKDDNFFELDWNLKRHNELLESYLPYTFIGNHDVTRIVTQVGRARAALATVLLFTLPGIPAVYYGDELGYEGLKEERLGGDDAVRPFFQPGNNEMLALYQQLIGLRRRHAQLTTARVETLELANELIRYRCGDVEVRLQLGDATSADIAAPGEEPIRVQLT